jgi:hypothetical protein
MKLTIEVATQSELEQIIHFFQSIKLESVRIIGDKLTRQAPKKSKRSAKITRGDKSLDPTELFGIWSENPRSVEIIRQEAWERPQNH